MQVSITLPSGSRIVTNGDDREKIDKAFRMIKEYMKGFELLDPLPTELSFRIEVRL